MGNSMRDISMTYESRRRRLRLPYRKATSGGVAPAARVQPVKPCRLLALRLAFLVRRQERRRPDVDRAGLRGVDVLDVRRPAVRKSPNLDCSHADILYAVNCFDAVRLRVL